VTVTLLDVARAAGVSRSTASRALSGSVAISPDARSRVEAAAAKLGYLPNRAAQSLRTRRTMLVGLVLNNLVNASFHVVAEVLQQRLDDRGYRMILCVTAADEDREARYLEMLAEQQADGVVLIGTGRNVTVLRRLASAGIPVVNLIRCAADAPGEAVLADDPDGGYLATEHLIQAGHRRIGYIGGHVGANSGRERFLGYTTALTAANLSIEDGLVVRGPFTESFGREAVATIIDRIDPPTAIYVANHEAAFGVLPELRERGVRVPDELSLVCHEDASWLRYWQPAITVIDNGAVELAEVAAARVLAAIEHSGTAQPVRPGRVLRVGAQIVKRESVGPPRADP
jgi:LacI family transcriptional regulator